MSGSRKRKWSCVEANKYFILLISFLHSCYTSLHHPPKIHFPPRNDSGALAKNRDDGGRYFCPDISDNQPHLKSLYMFPFPFKVTTEMYHTHTHTHETSFGLQWLLVTMIPIVFPIQQQARKESLNPVEVKLQTEMCSLR